MARKRLKQTKAAIAARRRYRAKKRRGGFVFARPVAARPRARLPVAIKGPIKWTKAQRARAAVAQRRWKARMKTPAMKRRLVKRKAAEKKFTSSARFKALMKFHKAKSGKGKKGGGFFLPALAAMFLPKLLGMGK